YSTLKLFESFDINIGTSAVPAYQDAAFKLNFRIKKGNISLFGIGGKSNIHIKVSEFTESQEDLYSDTDRDQYFETAMGIGGISYSHYFNSSTYGKLILAASGNQSLAYHELVYRNPETFVIDSLVPNLGYLFNEDKYSAVYFINKKVNASHSFKTGIHFDNYQFSYHDSTLNLFTREFFTRLNFNGDASLIQPYFQWKYRIDRLTATAGLHTQYFTLNENSKTIEPRFGLRYELNEKNALSFGAGLHSQMQPTYIYFNQTELSDGSVILHNKDLGFTRSAQIVLGWDYFLSRNIRIKTETYYQYLYDVPVEVEPSAFSVINQGTGFSRFFPDELVNEGTGTNYGLELTIEKFFSRKYFFLITGSLFDSKYKGSDGIERDTDFNSNYAANIMGGKEFRISKRSVLSLGTKITYAGGRLYSPADPVASALANELITIDTLTNTLRFDDYFRVDLKISWKLNAEKVTHEIALDLVNIFNKRNVLGLSYTPDTFNPKAEPIRREYQLGFLPLFYYRIEFGIKRTN
ncbi:MAG: TonB-dependent receptor domain-containing protein, partial [Bacteroidia bacterium]